MSEELVYTTVEGRKVKYKPVNPARVSAIQAKVRAEFAERGEPLEPPKYQAAVGNGFELFPHDETTITAKDVTAEEKEAWAQYKDAIHRLELAQWLRLAELLIWRGTAEPYPDTDWTKELVEDGIDIPDEPQAKYIKYMENIVVPSAYDQKCLVNRIMIVSQRGLDEELIEATEASFRGKARRKAAERPAGENPKE